MVKPSRDGYGQSRLLMLRWSNAIKLKRVQGFLGVDTETEAIDRMLEDYDFERTLTDLLKSGRDAFRGSRAGRW